MPQRRKIFAHLSLPPVRQYWRQVERANRLDDEDRRAKRRASDAKRPRCACEAYPFPHRPGGGLCGSGEQAVIKHAKLKKPRPHKTRYTGLLRTLCRNSGLHPIRDRAVIQKIGPAVVEAAKRLKRLHPHVKLRELKIQIRGDVSRLYQPETTRADSVKGNEVGHE